MPPSSPNTPPRAPSGEFLTRPLRLFIIWGSILMFVFCVWSALEARKKSSDRVIDWLPKGTQELEVFNERFVKHFFEGQYMMLSWKGCTLDDERIDIVAERLTSPPPGESANRVPFFEQPRSTRSVINDLMDVARLSEESAADRLAGWLIGQDGHTACLVLSPHYPGWHNPAAAVEFLFSTVEDVTGLARTDIYVAGTSIDSVAIGTIARKSQRILLPIFLLFSLFLLFCCLRHYFAAFIVFWVAVINEELAGTLLYWSGAHVDSVSMLNASLVYVLSISGSVHLINYYRKTLAEMQPGDDIRNVPMQTFRKAILPCTLAAVTTILGIGSLAVSQMVPIRTFGIFASMTLFLGTLWFFLFLLSVLQERPIKAFFPKNQETPKSRESNEESKSRVWSAAQSSGFNFWERFGLMIYRWRMSITALTFSSLIFFSFGIKDLNTSVTFHGLLPKDAKVLQDYRMLEESIGGLIPIEVVVHFPYEDWQESKVLDQLHFLQLLVDDFRQMEEVDAVVSVLNFLPGLPSQTGGGFRTVAQRAALEGILDRHPDRLRDLRFYNTVDAGVPDAGFYWRISLRLSTQKKLNYAVLIEDVRERLEAILMVADKVGGSRDAAVRFDVTGGVPLVQQAQRMLLEDLIASFMMAFALIAVTMIIILRGVVRGLLAMIPNVFPCVIVFGTLGLLGIPVDMGSMMTASVALGISVDGTLHLLTWVSLAMRRGMPRKEAVLYALQRCSTALTQTMIICGFGMLVFSLSEFVPVSRFAMLLCTILLISLAGAIIALPAILFSPLGRFFESSEKDKTKAWIL